MSDPAQDCHAEKMTIGPFLACVGGDQPGTVGGRRVVAVLPTGERTGMAFVSRAAGCTYEAVTSATYPPNEAGERLRNLRVEAGRSLGEAARLLGVGVAELSGIEWGRMRFEKDADYEDAALMLGAGPPSMERP